MTRSALDQDHVLHRSGRRPVRCPRPATRCIAGRYLCDVIGNRLTSSLGYLAGLRHAQQPHPAEPRRRASCSAWISPASAATSATCGPASARAKYWNVLGNFIFSLTAEGGYIHSFENGAARASIRSGSPTASSSAVRRSAASTFAASARASSACAIPSTSTRQSGRAGAECRARHRSDQRSPTTRSAAGLIISPAPSSKSRSAPACANSACRPSIYVDAGAVFGVRHAGADRHHARTIRSPSTQCTLTAGGTTRLTARRLRRQHRERSRRIAATPFQERFLGDSPSPRVSVGFGVNWNSPFGPFRIDIARALLSEPGDDTKLFTFNVGTAF